MQVKSHVDKLTVVLSDSEHIKLHNRKNKGDRYVAADKVFLLKMGKSRLIPD